jgi:hypothetical protein
MQNKPEKNEMQPESGTQSSLNTAKLRLEQAIEDYNRERLEFQVTQISGFLGRGTSDEATLQLLKERTRRLLQDPRLKRRVMKGTCLNVKSKRKKK